MWGFIDSSHITIHLWTTYDLSFVTLGRELWAFLRGEHSTFSPVSRLLFDGFSQNLTPRTFHAFATCDVSWFLTVGSEGNCTRRKQYICYWICA